MQAKSAENKLVESSSLTLPPLSPLLSFRRPRHSTPPSLNLGQIDQLPPHPLAPSHHAPQLLPSPIPSLPTLQRHLLLHEQMMERRVRLVQGVVGFAVVCE